MAQYSAELLAALRHRYEQTTQSERSIALEFAIAASTLRGIAARQGWVRPPPPVRDLQPAMRLLQRVNELARKVQGPNFRPVAAFPSTPRIPVARYTPDLLAALRRRYEESQQSIRSIALEFDVTERTLRRIAANSGWQRPAPAWHDLSRAGRLLQRVETLRQRASGMAAAKASSLGARGRRPDEK
jgi:transposase-like protein